MHFEQILQSMEPEGEQWRAWIPPDWLQGRSAFGGLQAALALQAMRALVPAIPLRSLQVCFIAPIPQGEVRIRAQLLRSGKSATQVEARLMEGDRTLCLVIGLFGARRVSKLALRPTARAHLAGTPQPTPSAAALGLPVFLQHFDLRWVKGGPPFSGLEQADAVIQVGMHSTAATSDLHLVAMADVIPPAALSQLTEFTPNSSMTWMLDLLTDDYAHLPLQDWRFDVQLIAAADGYTHQTATIWAPDGRPAMLSRQIMAVFG